MSVGDFKVPPNVLYHTVTTISTQAATRAEFVDLTSVLTTPNATSQSHLKSVAGIESNAPGRILAIDPGAKRVGVAISDELRMTAKPLEAIQRRSWKNLLQAISRIVTEFDVRALVVGLPLHMEGMEGDMAANSRNLAAKFRRSLSIPVFLQDERLTTFAATENLRAAGHKRRDVARQVDSESAAIILRDFINNEQT